MPKIVTQKVEKTQKVQPEEWKTIIANQPFEFCPRMIFKSDDGKWLWQASKNKQIDISNWLLYWEINGEDKLMTMDELHAATPE